MIGLIVMSLSQPAEKQQDACTKGEELYDGFFKMYGAGCKEMVEGDPRFLEYYFYCRGGFRCPSLGSECSSDDYQGAMKYPHDYIKVEKVPGCSGKTCPVEGEFEGNWFRMNYDGRPSWAQFPRWNTPEEKKGYCFVQMNWYDTPNAHNYDNINDYYADDRFNFSDSVDFVSMGGDYDEHYRFGCDDEKESDFNVSYDTLTAIRWPPNGEHKCKKGARSWYYKYDKDDGEYLVRERTLTDFWGTVKRTREEQNGIRTYKAKVGLSNKLSVAAGIGIAVAVSAVIVAIGCLIFYFVCKSKVAVKS